MTTLPADPPPDRQAMPRVTASAAPLVPGAGSFEEGRRLASDPERAMAALRGLALAEERRAFIAGLVAGVASRTPAEAVSLIAELAPGAERDFALHELAKAWGVDETEPEARDYLASTPLKEGLGVLVAVRDPVRGVAWAEGLAEGAARTQILHDSVRSLARTDLAQARDYTENRRDPAERYATASGLALSWAEREPTAALAWAAQQGDEGARTAAQKAALAVWARTDLPAATVAALALPEAQQYVALGAIALTLIARDEDAARRWAAALPAGATGDRLRELVAKSRPR